MTRLSSALLGSAAAIALAAGPIHAQVGTADNGLEPPAEGLLVAPEGERVAPRNYDEAYGETFGELGDRNVQELIGTEVVTSEGESIGEVENFALVGEQLAAIIGIGGFLGIGERKVALALGDLGWNGETLVASFSEEELRQTPEYDEGGAAIIAGENTLRTGFETTQMQPRPITEPEGVANEPAGVAQGAETAGEAPPLAGGEDAEIADAAPPAVAETIPAGSDAEMARGEGGETGQLIEPEIVDAPQEPQAGEATTIAESAGQTTPEPRATDAAGEPVIAEGAPQAAPADDAQLAQTGETSDDWAHQMDTVFADIADRPMADLIGMEVSGADGTTIGEVDGFALHDQNVVAVVGVGGLLGIGERDLALPLSGMTFDGESLVLSGVAEEQVSELPQFDADASTTLPADQTLRRAMGN